MKILVLGLGQSMRSDDAAGLEAVRLWQLKYPQTAQKARVELCELPGLTMLDLLEEVEAAVLVDAVHGAGAPGTLHHLGPDELTAFTTDARSAHGWGVAETLALGQSLHPGLAQCRIILIGIEVNRVDMGAGISPAIQVALPEIAALIEKEIQELLN